jgi:hypothetical protein
MLYKTPDATLIGQGLAGTIDRQTVRPLSFPQRTFAVNLCGQKDGVGSSGGGKGARLSTFYIDQFANLTLGVALGYARFQSKGDAVIREGGYTDVTVNGATVSAPNHLKIFRHLGMQLLTQGAAQAEVVPLLRQILLTSLSIAFITRSLRSL